MTQIIIFCIIMYLFVGAAATVVIWASLVLASQDDRTRGLDLLEGHERNWNQEKTVS